ncbi:serine/threonine protein kinase [filamentous cyanobacterium CCP5]|nr:serine/threonine protein kinase [filamentous cyanobacterium CCP5]
MDPKPLGGRYQIIRQLGAGGFSRTFLVKDLHLPSNPRCIIKQLEPQTRDPRALEMARRFFDTEAKVLYQLGNHPQIPTLLAHFEDNQEFYLAQEYIEGTHLSREFVKGVSWPQARVVLLMQEVLKVLLFVHDRQVIHRDIKPSNLIRRFQDNQIVLIDFGAVKRVSTSPLRELDTGSTNLTVAIGTQGYMPNEQYAGKPRYSSDVYAVGMLGIRALTGIHPRDILENLATGELNWRQHAPSVGPALAEVIDTMVRCDFRDRYPTALEALSALNNLPEAECSIYLSGTSYPTSMAAAGATESVLTTGQATDNAMEALHGDDSSTFLYGTAQTVIFDPNGSEFASGFNRAGLPGLRHQEDDGPSEGTEASDRGNTPSQSRDSQEEASPTRAARLGGWFPLAWIKNHPPLPKPVLIGLAPVTIVTVLAIVAVVEQRRPHPLQASAADLDLPSIPDQVLAIVSPEAMAAFQVKQADQSFLAGDLTAAMAGYEAAIQTKFDYAQAHLGRCLTFLELQKPNEATVACNDALAYRGYFPQAVRAKGQALEQQDRLLEALNYYQEANRQMPAMFQAWLDRGRVLHRLGRSAEAIDALDQAIARDRRSVEAWTIRGKANWALTRFDQVIVDLDKALMLQPDYQPAVEMRRQIRQQLGR